MTSEQRELNPEDYSNIAGRAWQQGGLGTFFGHLNDPGDFAVYACPGAGKTRFAIAAARAALNAEVVDAVVVVAPQSNVVTRWRDEFGELARINVRQPSGAAGLRTEMADRQHKHYVLTYSSLGRAGGDESTANLLAGICANQRVMVILDEVHHMAERHTWGESALVAFEEATIRLHLSGTPFRSDDAGIPWLMQPSELGLIVRDPDVSYTYSEAVVDGVCRPMFGHRMVAEITTEINGQPLVIDLNSVTVEDHVRAAVSVATDMIESPDYGYAAIRHGYDRLRRIRDEEQPNAAMMIVTKSVPNAQAAAEIFQEISDIVPVVIYSEDAGSATRLEGFRNSTAPCLINVKMASEGYDAPRIRVIVFLTNVKTELNWLQTMGRAIRREEPASQHDRQDAHVYFPPIPPLEGYMLRMTTEANDWIVENRPDFEGPRPVMDDEELEIALRRRERRGRGQQDMMRPATDNIRREGVILDDARMNEDLCSFVSEIGPYLPEAISVLRPERLAREYLNDPVMRSWVNMCARQEGIDLPTLRPEDLRRGSR